ncbi:MAG: hypothetical protein KF861_09920 [Planctomycetaceae bacterium]|nr:hypothetical protein [Planctomycetaceae bacterium]
MKLLKSRPHPTAREYDQRTTWVSASGRVSVWAYRRRRGRRVYYVRQREPLGSLWEHVSRHTDRAAAFAAAKRIDQRLQQAR